MTIKKAEIKQLGISNRGITGADGFKQKAITRIADPKFLHLMAALVCDYQKLMV